MSLSIANRFGNEGPPYDLQENRQAPDGAVADQGNTRDRHDQIGIPPNRYSGHYRGWIEAYKLSVVGLTLASKVRASLKRVNDDLGSSDRQ